MARDLKPCGTTAAARRHRRRGEEVCDSCRAAEKASRDDQARAARAKSRAESLPDLLSQTVELRFMYAKIKGALEAAEPKEVATLVKQGDVILERIAQLETPPTDEEGDDGDDIVKARLRRQERLATMG